MKTHTQKGFTLIESMIAIFVLTLSITAATSIVQQSLRNTTLLKARGQAVGLVIEGTEFVRNIYSESYLQDYIEGQSFYDFVQVCENGCKIAVIDEPQVSQGMVSSGYYTSCQDECPLYLHNRVGYSIEDTGNPSVFSRKVTITPTSNGDRFQFKVNTKVDFSVRGKKDSLENTTYLYLPLPSVPDLVP